MKSSDVLRGAGRLVASFLLMVSLSIVVAADLQAAPFAYIGNYGSGTVSVIDTATNTVTATVTVGGGVAGVAVHPNGTRVYITSQGTNMLSVIDTASNSVIATLGLGGLVGGVAVSPDGTRVYAVADHYAGAITVIDTATTTEILPRVSVGGGGSNGVVVSPDGTRVYVANQYSGTVSVIDTTTTPNAVIAIVTVGLGSGWPVADAISVDVSPDGTRVYVTNRDSQKVSVIDTTTNTVTVTVLVAWPLGIAVNPAGTRAYVTNVWDSTVSVIDTTTDSVISTFAVGTWPHGVDVDSTGMRVYVANYGSNNVSVIDTSTNTVVGTVAVGNTPIALGKFITGTATFTITASAGANGSIVPSGITTINSGDSQTFTITPDPGFLVADVLVDGSSIGAVTSYTFTNVTANHAIDASFANLYDSLRALLNGDCVAKQGILNSLTVKLNNAEAAEQRGDATAKAGMIGAFINEVQAQTGKAIDPECAAELIRLAQLLLG